LTSSLLDNLPLICLIIVYERIYEEIIYKHIFKDCRLIVFFASIIFSSYAAIFRRIQKLHYTADNNRYDGKSKESTLLKMSKNHAAISEMPSFIFYYEATYHIA